MNEFIPDDEMLIHYLLKRGLIDEGTLGKTYADNFGSAYVNANTSVLLEPNEVGLSKEQALEMNCIGLYKIGDTVSICTSRMHEEPGLHSTLEALIGMRVSFVFGFSWQIEEAIEKVYSKNSVKPHPVDESSEKVNQIDITSMFAAKKKKKRRAAA